MCRFLRDGPWRECAELIVRSGEPWSPRGHETFPRGARQRAVALLLIGAQLARRLDAVSEGRTGGHALLDVWVHHVLPSAVERRRYGVANDDPHCPGEDELLINGINHRTEPRGERTRWDEELQQGFGFNIPNPFDMPPPHPFS